MSERGSNRPQYSGGLNLSVGDVYHVLFRHKWKIGLISAAGVIAALLLPLIKKTPYTSEAKLYVRYILESSSPTPDANDPRIKLPDTRGDSIINTELEILTSLDLAQQVADTIGPEKILRAGGREPHKAGAALRKGLTAEVPKSSSVIRITFQHSNRDIVQPVLQQLIDLYLKKHTEIHAVGAFDDFLTQETQQLGSDLAKTEEDLGRAKTNLGFYASLEDAKKFQGEQISKIRQSIFDAEAELAERKAAAREFGNLYHMNPDAVGGTNTGVLPPEKIAEYRRVSNLVESLSKKEQEQSVIYKPESAWIQAMHKEVTNNVALKARLEKENPELLSIGFGETRRGESGSNPRADLAAELARVAALNSKIAVLNGQLERLQKEAESVKGAEGTITKLQLQKEIDERRYRHFVQGLEQARIDEKIGTGKVSNIGLIQKPSPPYLDGLKIMKARIAVVFAAFVMALGLAFFLEMFLDHSVKNSSEIEGKLGLPLLLAVPFIQKSTKSLNWFRRQLAWGHSNCLTEASTSPAEDTGDAVESLIGEMAQVDSELSLRPFFEALRDRLIGIFELRNLTHKPKLVAVTSCREGAGVSTLASGLAASLSETGDGNVLLVDMGQQNGAPRHFENGRITCGLDEALELEKRDGALVQENLYVVSGTGNGGGVPTERGLARLLPKRFTNLVPKLKASDYDFIIFDMPPISQISLTPRIAKFMDITLMVIEAEKTDRDVVKRGITLLGESKMNVCAVLNKRRTYVPNILQQELS
jgi:uncharacterized protein involved in exopolysaccharide biosynthesis/Mrp family chromosome partitioning ATPase